MPEVPLLGQTQPNQEEAPPDQTFVEAKTAFLIYLLEDGSVVMNPDINIPIVIENPPTQKEVLDAVTSVKRDIEAAQLAIQTAQLTLNNLPMALMQFQAQMQQSLQNAQIAAALRGEK